MLKKAVVVFKLCYLIVCPEERLQRHFNSTLSTACSTYSRKLLFPIHGNSTSKSAPHIVSRLRWDSSPRQPRREWPGTWKQVVKTAF